MQMEVVRGIPGNLDPGRRFYLFVWARQRILSSHRTHRRRADSSTSSSRVKAICIMLDAKIAEHTTVKQPAALNTKRIKIWPYSPTIGFVDLAKKYPFDGRRTQPGLHQR